MTISVQPKCVITEFTDWSAIEKLGNKRVHIGCTLLKR